MKGVQYYELFRGISLKNHAFFLFYLLLFIIYLLLFIYLQKRKKKYNKSISEENKTEYTPLLLALSSNIVYLVLSLSIIISIEKPF